jgi:hypothetical protein
MNLNKSSLLGRMRPTAELRCWTRLYGGLLSRPTLELIPVRHGPVGGRGRRAERVRTTPMRTGRAGWRACRWVTGGQGAPARLRRARAPPRALTGHPHNGAELVRRRGVGCDNGLTSGVGWGGSGIRRPPLLPVRWRNDQRGGM